MSRNRDICAWAPSKSEWSTAGGLSWQPSPLGGLDLYVTDGAKWRSQKGDCWTYVEFRVTQLSTKLVVFENSFIEVI